MPPSPSSSLSLSLALAAGASLASLGGRACNGLAWGWLVAGGAAVALLAVGGSVALGGLPAAAEGSGSPASARRWGRACLRAGAPLVCHGAAAALAAASALFALGAPAPVSLTASFGEPGLYAARVAQVGPRRPTASGFAVQSTVQLIARDGAHGSGWQPVAGRVRVELPGDVAFGRGDVIWLRLQLRRPRPARAPWGRSEAEQLRGEGVGWAARACSPVALVAQGHSLAARVDRLRLRLAARADSALPAHSAALVKALALGDASSVEPEVRQAFADAGMAHLLAVSGLHVSLVAGGASRLARPLAIRCSRVWPARWAYFVGVVAVWGYTALAGASVSAQRAAWMASLYAAVRGAGLGGACAGHGWSLALAIVLALDPLALRSAGAVLSFACVAALLLLAPFAVSARQRLVWRVAGAPLWGAALSLLTWPLCAAYFGRASLIAPWSNLVAIPLTSLLATPLSLLFILLVGAGAPAWAVAAASVGVHAAVMPLEILALACARLPWAAVVASPWPWAWTLAAWGAAMAACAGRRDARLPPVLRRFRAGHRAVAGLVLVALIAAGACQRAGRLGRLRPEAAGRVRAFVLDVGQGDATLVGFANGQWALIDGGGATYAGARDPGRHVVVPALQALGVRRLDLVVLTHPHPDHMHGLSYVLAHWPVRQLVYNEDGEHSPFVQRLAEGVRAAGGTAQRARSHYVFGDASVHILAPLQGRRASANDHSLMVCVRAYGKTMLIAGDVEAAGEADVLPHLSRVDVLRVAHHGSKTSSTVPFLRRVAPSLAAISCAPNNRFGFPHASTVATLAAHAGTTLTTAEFGTIEVQLRAAGVAWRAGADAALHEAGPQKGGVALDEAANERFGGGDVRLLERLAD